MDLVLHRVVNLADEETELGHVRLGRDLPLLAVVDAADDGDAAENNGYRSGLGHV